MTGAGLPVAVPSPGVPTSLATTSVRKGGGGRGPPPPLQKVGGNEPFGGIVELKFEMI